MTTPDSLATLPPLWPLHRVQISTTPVDATQAFREFVLASYVSAYDTYDGQVAEIAPATRTVGRLQIVSLTLNRPDSGGTTTAYVMAEKGDAWRVQDILLDGTISRVAMQRSDFRAFLSDGNAMKLIATLRDKATQLAEAA